MKGFPVIIRQRAQLSVELQALLFELKPLGNELSPPAVQPGFGLKDSEGVQRGVRGLSKRTGAPGGRVDELLEPLIDLTYRELQRLALNLIILARQQQASSQPPDPQFQCVTVIPLSLSVLEIRSRDLPEPAEESSRLDRAATDSLRRPRCE